MLIFLGFVLLLVFGFIFFSRPRVEISSPTADIETPSGRTTIFHYRSKLRQGKGVIVLVHGFCENHMYFQTISEPLTAAGYDCLAINLFGYGGSIPSVPGSYTVEAYARQVCDALLELKRLRLVKRLAAVWGHSMGGAAVFLAAPSIVSMHPEVQAIVLENPGFGNVLTALAHLLRPFTRLTNFAGPRFVLQLFVNVLFGISIKPPQAKQFIKKILISHAPKKEVAIPNVNSVLKLTFSTEPLSENVARRLHWIISKRDKLFSFKKVEKFILQRLRETPSFAEHQIFLLPNADHFVCLQKPIEAAGFVLKHLEKEGVSVQPEAIDHRFHQLHK
jgi:pimeloyl-ACP methyl ester carboxylesterase